MLSTRVNESGDSLRDGENPGKRRVGKPRGRRWRRAFRVSAAAVAAFLCCAHILSASTPSLLWVQAPVEGDVIGVGGVEVMIRFPRERQIEADSFVALLNGADVTQELITGANGAVGRLFGLLEGENTLHFEVRGDRGGVPDRFLPDVRDVRFLVRLPQGVNRG